ncbi:MAG: hypothetical protein ACOC98_02040 [Thermodesulfobacteriota bacterium]
MRLKWQWLPWKFIVRRLARTHGFFDPVLFLSRFGKFAQPSEVAAPVELLRASLVFHARGLLNARTIQTNLDWVWPFWVRRQFDPADPAFVPRSYTITHVNLTHRNWTAAGLPDLFAYPIVDPRGLATPFFDGWSLDGWVLRSDETDLIPARLEAADQTLVMEDDRLAVRTRLACGGAEVESEVDVVMEGNQPVCRVRFAASSPEPATFVLALRPCNPEGVSFVHDVEMSSDLNRWRVDEVDAIQLDPPAEGHRASRFEDGDVYRGFSRRPSRRSIHCPVGLATAAAEYALTPGEARTVTASVRLDRDPENSNLFPAARTDTDWSRTLEGVTRLQVPDDRIQYLWDAAVRATILHSPMEIYPGPFYYKRFWFRDAAFILHPMLALGMHDRAERLIGDFPRRQESDGYFRSQQGEWDSNGQVMWIMGRFAAFAGREIPPDWLTAVVRAGKWIQRKRTAKTAGVRHGGLLPAGFSAEHLGHNDFYYWDDFWSVAGLREGAGLLSAAGEGEASGIFRDWADDLMACIDRSLTAARDAAGENGIPASPYRRMDSGAIGSIVAGYPLRLLSADDPGLLATVNHLVDHHFIDHAFFQDMFHAGYNPYLTLHCAQVLLRAGDPRHFPIVSRIAELASPTGQWPEAIHPHTLGGCQGDGQHIWAAAEWLMMVRNLFVLERGEAGLDLLPGVPPAWLEGPFPLKFGPAHTPFGWLHL